MQVESLVSMVNKIEDFFRVEDDREVAIEGIRNHVARFWERRMRERILAHLHSGGEGLGELARAAIERLQQPGKAGG